MVGDLSALRLPDRIFGLTPLKRLIFLFLYTKIISKIKITERKDNLPFPTKGPL